MLLTSATLRRLEAGSSEIGLQRHYRAVSIGTSLESAEVRSFTNAAVGLECYSPALIRGYRGSDNDWLIDWVRRTRIGGEWRDYVDVPLGETTESYGVEIYSPSLLTLVRTLSAVTSPQTYTSARQSTDFGAAQDTLGVKVYQRSANLGRGYPASEVFPYIAPGSFPLTVWNLLDKSANIFLSATELKATASASGWKTVRASSSRSSGKYYFEVKIDATDAGRNHMVGICQSGTGLENHLASSLGRGYLGSDGNFWNRSSTGAPGVTYTTGDVVGVAFNADTATMPPSCETTRSRAASPPSPRRPSRSSAALLRRGWGSCGASFPPWPRCRGCGETRCARSWRDDFVNPPNQRT